MIEDGKELGYGCYSYDFLGDFEEASLRDIMEDNLIPFELGYDDLGLELFGIVGYDIKKYVDKILCVDSITRKSVYAKPFFTDFKRQIKNVDKLVIDVDGFRNNIKLTDDKSIRAFDTITYGLQEMEGLSWVRS